VDLSFWFITYSMGLRLAEAIYLTVDDIDRAHDRPYLCAAVGAIQNQ
jgi:site-specific recombinase XerD